MKKKSWKFLYSISAGLLLLAGGSIIHAEETAVIGGADGPTGIFLAGEEENAEAFQSQDPEEAAKAFLKEFYSIGFAEADGILNLFSEEQEQMAGELTEGTEGPAAPSEKTEEIEKITEGASEEAEASGEVQVTVIGEDVEEPYTYSFDSVLGALEQISPYKYMTREAWEELSASRGLTRLYGLVQDAGQDLAAEEITLEETSGDDEEVKYNFQVSLKFSGEGEESFEISGQMDLISGTEGWQVERFYTSL